MKSVATFVVGLALCCALIAAPSRGEEIEFRHEPSFSDGTLIWLARLPNGKIHCAAYLLPISDDGGIASHEKAKPKLLKEVPVSQEQFEALVRTIEGAELRSEAEEKDPVGIDGDTWVFRRKAAGRTLELRFWSPRDSSAASKAGAHFLSVAQIDGLKRRK